MKLRSPKFERRARRLINAEVRKSKELRKIKQSNPPTPSALVASISRIFIAWFVGVIAVGIATGVGQYAGGPLNVLVLLWIGLIPTFAILAIGQLEQAAAPIYHYLPLSREQVYAVVKSRALKKLGYLIFPVFLACGLSAVEFRDSDGLFLAHIAAQLLVAFAAVVHLVAYSHKHHSKWFLLSFGVAVGVIVALPDRKAALATAEWAANAALPVGWVNVAALGHGPARWLSLIAAALFVAAVPHSVNRIRRRIVDSVIWDFDLADFPSSFEPERNEGRGPTELEDAAVEGEMFNESAPETIERRWIEKLAWRMFGASQIHAAEFLWPYGVAWTSAWIGTAKALLITTFLTWIAWTLFPDLTVTIIAAIAGPVISLFAAPLFQFRYGVRAIFAGGMISPLFAGFPISYRAMYSTILRANFARILAWAPLIVSYAGTVGFITTGSARAGISYAAAFVFVISAAQPALVASALGVNATLVGWSGKTAKLAMALMLFVILGGIVVIFCLAVVDDKMFVMMAAIVSAFILVASMAIQSLQRMCYRRRGMDLLSAPRRR